MIFRGGRLKDAESFEDAFLRYQEYVESIDSYSGTFAAKMPGLVIIDGDWTPAAAAANCIYGNKHYEPSYIYKLKDGDFWIGGWCKK